MVEKNVVLTHIYIQYFQHPLRILYNIMQQIFPQMNEFWNAGSASKKHSQNETNLKAYSAIQLLTNSSDFKIGMHLIFLTSLYLCETLQ